MNYENMDIDKYYDDKARKNEELVDAYWQAIKYTFVILVILRIVGII